MGLGLHPKALDHITNLIVNARSDPTGNAGKRTQFSLVDTGLGVHPKTLNFNKMLIVNAQGEPVQTPSGTNPFGENVNVQTDA